MTDPRVAYRPQTSRALEAPHGFGNEPMDGSFEGHFDQDFMAVLENTTVHRSTIGCVIPAYNEEESIAEVIEGLLSQTRVPDVIHVVVNNTSDNTVKIASQYAGPHEVTTDLGEQFTEVFVHDIGKNPDKKVGALNYGYSLVEGCDYLLGVDGDTVADSRAVEYLETEAVSDSRIGGISAIYTIDDAPIKGTIAKWLIAGQRTQFAAFNLQNLLRGRNMAVLGGQFSIFSTNALRWTFGAIELMWPGQRGDTKGQPFHPNLRLRWFENFGMLTNLFVRVAFLVLLAGSLSINAFVFSPFWLIPIAIAILLNVRIARTMKECNQRDVMFAALGFPAEIFMWIRLSHFVRSWSRFFSRKKVDNWAMQAKAERGGASIGHWAPFIILALVMVAGAVVWTMLGPVVQSSILWIGWPIVGVVTVLQTLLMLTKLFRRYQGYKV
ncbi:MAG: glycosyl transferase [Microbacterium sp.]|nr:glycosyl transferase [Microbacterium sp.]